MQFQPPDVTESQRHACEKDARPETSSNFELLAARKRLQELNAVLDERNAELAFTIAQLEEEISLRKNVEAELRESKDHYFHLFQQAHAMEEDLRELSAKVLSAQEEERKRISRELHDEIGQALTAVNVAVAMLKRQARSNPEFQKKVLDAEQLLANSMETVHHFARELRPAMLDYLGLHSALRAHVATFGKRTGIRAELVGHPIMARVAGPRAEVLFRVAQEALNNVFKHARATVVRIGFTAVDEKLDMEIADNGCAFCVEEKLGPKRGGRLGLLGMQERVRLVNGTFSVESLPGQGTRVRVQIPLDDLPKSVAAAGQPEPARTTSAQSTAQDSFHEKHIRAAC